MLDSKNKIGNISDSNIGKINQFNIEKQENNIIINKNEINAIGTCNFTDVALSHCLFPDFIVDIKKMYNGKYTLVSKPTRKKSTINYPFNYKSSFIVTDERFKDIKDRKVLLDMLQYADSPVEIKVTKFEQYLGDVIDPYPDPELSPMHEGVKTYIMPQKRELPKINFKVDIGFDNSKFKLKNINLRLTKQLSSNKFILDNYAQSLMPVLIQLELEFVNDSEVKCNLNYKINPEKLNDSKAVYTFKQFTLNLLTKNYYMYDKDKEKVIMAGKNNKRYNKNEIKGLESYINLIKAIIEIEKYFNVKFDIPNKIPEDDIDTIKELYKKIKENKKIIKAINLELSVLKKDANIEKLKQLSKLSETSIMTTYQDVVFNILGKDIKIKKITEKYDLIKCSNVAEIEEFIKNYELLNDDYELRIKMIPAKGKTFYKYTEIMKDES